MRGGARIKAVPMDGGSGESGVVDTVNGVDKKRGKGEPRSRECSWVLFDPRYL